MSKMVSWYTTQYSNSSVPHDTDSVFYAENVVRYVKFTAGFSLKYCLAETLSYDIGRKHIVVPPGAYYLVNRGTEMECLPSLPNGKVMFIYFTDALLSDIKRNLEHSDKALLDNPLHTDEPVSFLEHVYRQPDALSLPLRQLAQRLMKSEGSMEFPPDLFYEIGGRILKMQDAVFRQMQGFEVQNHSTRKELYRRMLLARDFMHDHWQDNLPVVRIAQEICLSPYHFHRRFREAFGQTPGEWFRYLKLEKARAMLSRGSPSVTQIALDCGFSSVFSFSKAYKKAYGISPSGLTKAS